MLSLGVTLICIDVARRRDLLEQSCLEEIRHAEEHSGKEEDGEMEERFDMNVLLGLVFLNKIKNQIKSSFKEWMYDSARDLQFVWDHLY